MIRWKKKSEIDTNLKSESDTTADQKKSDEEPVNSKSLLPAIKIEFKDENDEYKRVR